MLHHSDVAFSTEARISVTRSRLAVWRMYTYIYIRPELYPRRTSRLQVKDIMRS